MKRPLTKQSCLTVATPRRYSPDMWLWGGTATACGFDQVIFENEAALSTSYSLPGVEGSINKSVCVIGSARRENKVKILLTNKGQKNYRVMLPLRERLSGIWWEFYLPEGSGWSSSSELEKAANAVPCEHEYEQTGLWMMLNPFMEAKVDSTSSSFVAPNGGPFIYCLGGSGLLGPRSHSHFKDVRVLHVEDNTWTSGPDMISARICPVTVDVDGKIYAFSGVDCDECPPDVWAEFLDTEVSVPEWKPLASPPQLLYLCGLFAVVLDDGENIIFGKKEEDGVDSVSSNVAKTILVGSSCDGVLFLYHIIEDRWQSVPPEYDIPVGFFGFKPVAVGHTLFWVEDYFYAYDLRRRVMYMGVVRGLCNYIQQILWSDRHTTFTHHLNHLGGDDFCLTWFDWLDDNSCFLHRLHSTVIRVRTCDDWSPEPGFRALDAFVVSSLSYLIPQDFGLECSLLLNKSSSEERNLEDGGDENVEENA